MEPKERAQFAARVAASFAGLMVAAILVRRLLGLPTPGLWRGIAASIAIGACIGAVAYAYQAWIARHPRLKL